jgi:hypothetical protein
MRFILPFLVVFVLIMGNTASNVSAQDATPPIEKMCEGGASPDANGDCPNMAEATPDTTTAAAQPNPSFVCVGGPNDGQSVTNQEDCFAQATVYVCPDRTEVTNPDLCFPEDTTSQTPVTNPAPAAVAPAPAQAVTPQVVAPVSATPQWTDTCPDQGEVTEVMRISMLPAGQEFCTFSYGAPDITGFELIAPHGSLVTFTTQNGKQTFILQGDGQTYPAIRGTLRPLGGDFCTYWAGEANTGRMQNPPFTVTAVIRETDCPAAEAAQSTMSYDAFVAQFGSNAASPAVSAPVPATQAPVEVPVETPAVQTTQTTACSPETAAGLFAAVDPSLGNASYWKPDPNGNPNKVVYEGPLASPIVPNGYSMDYDAGGYGANATAGTQISGTVFTLNCGG